MGNSDFEDLTFEKFRQIASDPALSRHERVGFPNSYREGKEDAIFADISSKLSNLDLRGKVVLEIGPGCSRLPSMLIDACRERGHRLILVDSEEMLVQLPSAAFVEKLAGRFPDVPGLLSEYAGKVDAILTYSVIQYEFADGNIWDFLDRALQLLSIGGEMLIGDVPNISMRKRFFASESGIASHREFTATQDAPEVHFNVPEPGKMDDSVVLGLLARARSAGFHAWVLPQSAELPMANRREDILIRRP
jgi:hypothetical protein